MQVLDDEQHRSAAGCLAHRCGNGLEQALTGVLRRALGAGGVRVELRQEAGELPRDPRGQLLPRARHIRPQGLGEGREHPGVVVTAAPRQHQAAAPLDLGRQLGEQARLAGAGLTLDGRHGRGTGASRAPGGQQPRKRLGAADQRGVRTVREGGWQGQVERGRPVLGSQPGRELAGIGRRRHAEFAAQRPGERLVRGNRGGGVAPGGEPPHQDAGGVLGERVELEPAARVRHRGVVVPARLGLLAERGEQAANPIAVIVPRLEHPVVVEVGEQRSVAAQLDGLRPAALPREPVDLTHVDPEAGTVEAHALAIGGEVVARLAELAPQGRERRAQARARAAVEHVGPEHRGHARARVPSRVESEPSEQGARPSTRDRVQRPALDLDAKLTLETDAQHGRAE